VTSLVLASVLDLVQIAHETGFPHQDPVPGKGDGGGASPVIILAGIVVSLLAVAGLIWLKRRTDA
jgi:LPXTG-motif cell wall-anchored protein